MTGHKGEGAAGYEHLMAVSNATTLLIQAARVSPPLIQAARLVDLEIHTLRDEIDRLRSALNDIRLWNPKHGLGYEGPQAIAEEALDRVVPSGGDAR